MSSMTDSLPAHSHPVINKKLIFPMPAVFVCREYKKAGYLLEEICTLSKEECKDVSVHTQEYKHVHAYT